MSPDQTPQIQALAKSWRLLDFDEVIEVVSDRGRRVKQRDYLSEGIIPVIDQGKAAIGGYTNDEEMAFDGSLPVLLFGDHTKVVKLITHRFVVGADGVKLLRPKATHSTKFLFYWLHYCPLPDRGYSRHFQFLRQAKFPTPPRAEQDRIVAEIEKQFTRLDAATGTLRRACRSLHRLRTALLGVTYKPWPTVKFGALLMSISGGTTAVPVDEVSGLPVLRSSSVKGTKLDLEDVRYLTGDAAKCSSIIKEGDLLVTRLSGTRDYVANCALVTGLEGRRIAYPDRLFCARVTAGVVPSFVPLVFASPFTRTQIEKLTRSSAGHQRVSISDIKELQFPLPPLSEQRRIVAELGQRLSTVSQLEALIGANLHRADRLRHSILKRAFEGRLVPQTELAVAQETT